MNARLSLMLALALLVLPTLGASSAAANGRVYEFGGCTFTADPAEWIAGSVHGEVRLIGDCDGTIKTYVLEAADENGRNARVVRKTSGAAEAINPAYADVERTYLSDPSDRCAASSRTRYYATWFEYRNPSGTKFLSTRGEYAPKGRNCDNPA